MAGSGAAEAHPLGNFTINLYGGLTVAAHGIDVDYVVDMAEIPAFEEQRAIDRNHDGTIDAGESAAYVTETCGRLADGLTVTVGRTPRPLTSAGTGGVTFPPGAGGLSTMRLECPLHVAASLQQGDHVTYRDANFAGRIGWHEVTATGDRLELLDSDVPSQSVSGRLSAYPADLLQSPLDQRDASFTVGAATTTAAAAAPAAAPITRGFGDRLTTAFAGVVTKGGSSPLLWLLALATAFAIGGVHALGPGHGKTLMAAYLVGSDARPRQVVAVGAAVSVMHTASVVVLGMAVLIAGQAFTPEVAYRWTTIASGALVAGLGAYLLRSRILAASHARRHDHGHEHSHDHGEHGHSHERPAGRFGLATLAVSGGILPSPSALIALLAAIAIGRLVFGLALVLAFGVGLATVLVAVGFGTIKARQTLSERLSTRLRTWAPVASAAGVFLLGLVLVARTV
jgi:ABC-type nickel/cobalt efflux system permease component RcnA